MKLRLPLALAAAVLSACVYFPAVQAETILTFDSDQVNKNLIFDYGSYAKESTPAGSAGIPAYTVNGLGTPNIGLKFWPVDTVGGNNGSVWQLYGGDNVWGSTPTGGISPNGVAQIEMKKAQITFTPNQNGAGVTLGKFNFMGWTTGHEFSYTIIVTGSDAPDSILKKIDYNFKVDMTKPYSGSEWIDLSDVKGKFGESLTLTLILKSDSNTDSIALDNLSFSQFNYSGTTLSRVLAEGASVSWDESGWKNGTADVQWTNASEEAGVVAELAGGAGGSTLRLGEGEIRIADKIAVTGGLVTLEGGEIKLSKLGELSVSQGAQLTVTTKISSDTQNSDMIVVSGQGLVVLKKEQMWGNVSGSGKLQLDANLTLNGSSVGREAVTLSGSGSFYREGTGTTLIGDISGMSGEARLYVNGGTVKAITKEILVGDSGQRVVLGDKGTLVFDAATVALSELIPTIAGNGTLSLSATGGTSGDDAGLSLDLRQSDFTGEILFRQGVLNVSTSQLVNKSGGNVVLGLDGGGILSTEEKNLSHTILVGQAGFIRSKAGTLTLSGAIRKKEGEASTLTFYGDNHITGDYSQYGGNFSVLSGAKLTLGTSGKVNTISTDGGEIVFSAGSKIVSAGSLNVYNSKKVTFAGQYISSGELSIEKNAQVDLLDGADLVINRLVTSNTNSNSEEGSVLNIKKGASLRVTGNTNTKDNKASILLGHWVGKSNINIDGLLESETAKAYIGFQKDKEVTVNINKTGVVNLLGVYFHYDTHKFNVNGGILNLGLAGIEKADETHNTKISVNGGILGAYVATTEIKTGIELTGAEGIIFNTGKYDLSKKSYTDTGTEIKVSGIISEATSITGTVVKKGYGVLRLSSANTFTGGVTLESGTLFLGNVNSLGKDGKRHLTVTGDAILLTDSLKTKTVDVLTVKEGASLNIGGINKAAVLSVGSVSDKSTFIMDLLAGTSDQLEIGSPLTGTINLEFFLSKDSIGQTYTVLKGVSSGDKDKVLINSGYRDTLRLEKSSNGLDITVSGTITSEAISWKNTGTSGVWKKGTDGAASWEMTVGGSAAEFYQADKVTFKAPSLSQVDVNKNHTVYLDGLLAPDSVTVITGKDLNYVFANNERTTGYLTGAMTLDKDGEGTLLLSTSMASDYTGKTTVTAGTLEFAMGAFLGSGDIEVKEGASLKVHELLSNAMTINGSYVLGLSGATTFELGDMNKVIWGANSSLVIAEGAIKGSASMFKGKTMVLEPGGAFDIAGVDRQKQRFDLELSGKGTLVNGVNSGALFSSTGTLGDWKDNVASSGIANVLLAGDAMITTKGDKATGDFTRGNSFDFKNGELNLGKFTLSKTGLGALWLDNVTSKTDSGTLRIESGTVLTKNANFGTKDGSKAKIEILAGAGFCMLSPKTVYADVILDSSSTDLSLDYVGRNYASLFSYTSSSSVVGEYGGKVTLVNGAALLLGWGFSDGTSGHMAFSGQLTGSGTLYLDTTGARLDDDNTENGVNRIRHFYLGAEVTGIDGVELVGALGRRTVLQLSTVNSGKASGGNNQNATIKEGLKITGGEYGIVKVITTGTGVTFSGLEFAIAKGFQSGMELRVQPESTTSSQWTTMADTTGVLQVINQKERSKLALNGTKTDLTVNENLNLAGQSSQFLLGGGKLTIKGNVNVEGTSQVELSGADANMTVGGSVNLMGVDSKWLMQGGKLVIDKGRLMMSAGSQFEISGKDTLFESKGIEASTRQGMTIEGASALFSVKGGTVKLAGKTMIGVGAKVEQTDGSLHLEDVWMSQYDSNKVMSYYNLKGGELHVSGDFQIGNEGSATLDISDGVANINKLSFGKANVADQKFVLNLSGTGRLNLGGGNMVDNNSAASSVKEINFSGGTLGAMKNWSTSMELSLKSGNMTVDTTLTSGEKGEIKWLGNVKGSGSFTVSGTGVLELGGTNSFTSDVTVGGNSTLKLNTDKGLSAKVILQENGTFRMGGANMRAGAFDIKGGELILDQAGAIVGQVDVNGGDFNMKLAGVSAGAVTMGSGRINVSADAQLASLDVKGGEVNVSGGTLSLGNRNLIFSQGGILKFTDKGSLNGETQISFNSASSVVEMAKSEDNVFSNQLHSNGIFRIANNDQVTTTYTGDSSTFSGKVEVKSQSILSVQGNLGNGDALVDEGALLIFEGKAEQLNVVTGKGKVSFSNKEVNITRTSLLSGFAGSLLVGADQNVTFTYNNASFLGSLSKVEFAGSNGHLNLNNGAGSSDFVETIRDIKLSTAGYIDLGGEGIDVSLSGTSWHGTGDQSLAKLYLKPGSNTIKVDSSLSDTQLERLMMWALNEETQEWAYVGVILDKQNGSLNPDRPMELRQSQVNTPAQSYNLSVDHSLAGNPTLDGKHVLDGYTYIRALTITASDISGKKNTGLVLNEGVKLALDKGKLDIIGEAGYAITGGTLGRNRYSEMDSQFTISQEAMGGVAISSRVDDTVGLLYKTGGQKLVMSGALENRAGVTVDGGILELTGTSVKRDAWLTNRSATLVLGDGKGAYTVNYSGLKNLITEGSKVKPVTILSEKARLDKSFMVENDGILRLQIGGNFSFDKAFSGSGTSEISNKTHIELPQGGVQGFKVEKDSSLTLNLSKVGSTGGVMSGEGDVILKNTSGSSLNLSSENIGSSWLGFTGTLNVTGTQPMTFKTTLMGNGATVILSAGSYWMDAGTESDTRVYNVTLGERATWQLKNGANYSGTLLLGGEGSLVQTGGDSIATVDSDVSGGSLHLVGGTFSLGGKNSTHEMTIVGASTKVIGIGSGAFGQGLDLTADGSLALVSGRVETGRLVVGDVGGLEMATGGSLSVSNGAEISGSLTGKGELKLGGTSSITGGSEEAGFSGILEVLSNGNLHLSSGLGSAAIHVGTGGILDISGNTQLVNNTITMDSDSRLGGGVDFGGRLEVSGGNVSAMGNVNLDSLHMTTDKSRLEVGGNLTIANGGSFLLSDNNCQAAFGSIVHASGSITLSGVFGIDLDVNNSFDEKYGNTQTFLLFKADQGLVVNVPEKGTNIRFDLDISMREFFTLNQDNFTSTGIISVTRKEMTCYLLDPSYVSEGGMYADGFRSPNSASYLGANANNDGAMHDGVEYPEIFFYDKDYTIAAQDNAYRLTNGDAWMNFHVTMTDQQLDAPTKLVVRDNWMSKTENAGGVILSIRGNADNTFSGGTQIFQTKVKVDGMQNGKPGVSEPMSAGDVYFFGTGSVEAIGDKAEIILNTGGDGSKAEYLFYNDFLLQQGAVLTQTSSTNVLMGSLTVKDMATIRNETDNALIFSGSKLNGMTLRIQGAAGAKGAIRLEGTTGEKVNAKFSTVDVNNSGRLSVGRNATANIGSLYMDKGSSVTMTEGGVLAVKEIKNGANGRGDVILAGGTFKAMGDFAITENGASYSVTSASTFDTNGYYLEVNQYLVGWSDFAVTGGGKMKLIKDLSSFENHVTIAGESTNIIISKGVTLNGTWTVRDGGTLKTEENVAIRGTLNIEKGGSTDFGTGTWMDSALIHLKDGATYAGFLKGNGATINFESGSRFQVKTEDLRKLTDTEEKAMLTATTVNIENGRNFFNFSGGDGIVNDAILDSGQEKTLIIGTESLTVGGLDQSALRSGALGMDASELTAEQLAAMVGETNYRWLSFVLTADEVGETGSKINVTVTRNVNFAELAQTSNEIAIAPTLSYIGMEGGKADSKLEGEELNQLGFALTKAAGDAYSMLSNISLSTSSVMAGYSVQRENLRRHSLELRDRAVQERPCALRNQYETLENTVWASGQGGTYSVDGDNNAVGHTTSLWGGQLGVSRCVNDKLVLGLAFTYTTSEITLDQGMGDATSDAYYIDLYAKYHKDNWNVTGILTGGFTDLSTERNMAIEGFSSRTKGSSSGNQLMGMVEVGYEIDLDGDRSNIIEPFAAVTAGYSSIDGFEETGAGSAGLNVASQSDTSCSIGAGVRYVKEFSTSSDELLRGRFEVRAMILQDLTDNEVDVEARFIGANGQSFTQKSTEIGKTGFLLGTGVVVPTSANMSLFADLNGEFRSSETGCNANIGVKYNF